MIEISLGQRLRELRDRADLSLRELAKRIGIFSPFLSDIELGRRFPSEGILEKLAAALNVSLEELKKYDNREPIADLGARRQQRHQAYLWQYSRPGGAVVFDFQTRSGTRRTEAVFGQLRGHPSDGVAQMDQLFEIDAQARQAALTPEVHLVLRLEKSKPLVDAIKSQIEAARATALPKSLLAKACKYTLTLWPRLIRFLEYPELELSDNWAENAISPVALGRKNWINIGSEEAGPRVAAISRSWKSVGDLNCRFATILARYSRAWLTFRSVELPN